MLELRWSDGWEVLNIALSVVTETKIKGILYGQITLWLNLPTA